MSLTRKFARMILSAAQHLFFTSLRNMNSEGLKLTKYRILLNLDSTCMVYEGDQSLIKYFFATLLILVVVGIELWSWSPTPSRLVNCIQKSHVAEPLFFVISCIRQVFIFTWEISRQICRYSMNICKLLTSIIPSWLLSLQNQFSFKKSL